jgi:GWxTD domain-containing protein
MTAQKRIAVTLYFITALLTVSASAQPADRRPESRVQDDIVSFEAFFRSVQPDSATVDILFRFRRDFFVFAREPGALTFSATGEVTVEILDSTDNSISRHIQSITLSSNDNSPVFLRQQSWQGLATFRLPRGRMTALCVLTDKESAQKQFQVRLPLIAHRLIAAASSPLLVRSFDSATGLIPCNVGGSALFNSPLYLVTAVRPITRRATATYSLTRNLYDGEEHSVFQKDTTVSVTVLRGRRLVPGLDSNNAVVYAFAPDSLQSIAVLKLPGEQLPQGRYDLRLRFDDADTNSLRLSFGVRWSDMPQSLRDLDFATAAMKYITTDDEFDRLRSGRHALRVQAFDDFWKNQDPTPATAYNERLAEYFRRVDYAYVTFRTLKEENGIVTDRGRIYILYGAPSVKDRLLSREVWQYASLKKIFTFEDTSRQGNYKLIQTDTQ